jgi:hypothetical protein
MSTTMTASPVPANQAPPAFTVTWCICPPSLPQSLKAARQTRALDEG